MRRSVIIVGGGFCGVMVLHHLMQCDGLPSLDITWYDAAGRHGRGVAYATPHREHLLNVPAAGMSAIADDPAHFLRWLGNDANPAGFYPRCVYGDYLGALMDESLRLAAEKGHHVTLRTETCAQPAGTGDDIVVYATGTSHPVLPGGPVDDPRMIADPYGADILSVPQGARVVVILGTGLSAVDAILSLDRAGFGGRIICISRTGLWPVAHGPKGRPWYWRRYIDALRPHSNRVWQSMPGWLRAFCLRHITVWNVLRHRMPPECAAVLARLRREGRLQTHRGRVCGVTGTADHIAIDMAGGYRVSGDVAVNCLGYIPYRRSPARGFRLSEREWILGAPLFGHLIETTAVPELRVQARDVAADIAGYLGGSSTV